MKLKKHVILITLLEISIISSVFSQSSNGVYIKSSFGLQSDYIEGVSNFGGGIGLGFDITEKPNRWQIGINLDKFPNKNPKVLPNHEFNQLAASVALGRMWTTNREIIGERIQIGLGVLGITSLQSGTEQINYLGSRSSVGLYWKLEYPLLRSKLGQMNFMYENSIFAPGFFRNSFGLSFLLHKYD